MTIAKKIFYNFTVPFHIFKWNIIDTTDDRIRLTDIFCLSAIIQKMTQAPDGYELGMKFVQLTKHCLLFLMKGLKSTIKRNLKTSWIIFRLLDY